MKLQIENISKSYGSVRALKDISFQVRDSQIVGLLGRNGSGKTTLIKTILKIIDPDTGEVNIEYNNDENRKIGFLPEERGLYLNMTVKDQLMFISRLNGLSKKESLESIKYYLNELEIPQYLNTKVKQLSKGNKQKIQLISSLTHNPKLIILDEPFSGLDPVNVTLFKTIIRKRKDEGKIILLSSHRLEDIEEMCDHVIFLKDGQVLVQGSVDSIKSRYSHEKVLKIISKQDIEQYIHNQKLEYDVIKENNYLIKYDNYSDVSTLMKNILTDNIEILNFEKIQVTLNDIFVKELKNEA